jgi:RNA polymerase sigma factor (sigma-70 family)
VTEWGASGGPAVSERDDEGPVAAAVPDDGDGPATPVDARDWRAADDAALLDGMRAAATGAYRELYERYAPVLRALAQRLRPGDPATRDLADDVLTDTAERVRRDPTFAPERLPAYLAGALVRQIADATRRAHRRRAVEDGAAEDIAGSAERVLRDVVSEYAVRACAGPAADPDAARLAPALGRLAAALGAACTPRERELLRLLADAVPQPEIARALGLTYGAARARIHRFRKRVWAWAAAYVASLPAAERAEVRRFLRRAGGPLADSSHHPEPRRPRRVDPSPETAP